VGAAVKVPLAPAQLDKLLTETVTEGATDVLTFIVIVFELAVGWAVQFALEVRTQVTWSPLIRALFEYVLLFAPTVEPLSIHW
jgi:hypothetical protein